MEANTEHWLRVSELCDESETFCGMIIKSLEDKRLVRTITRLGPYRSTVLIQGESGTGKDLAAQALHRFGPSPNGPFVTFNCSNLIPSLAESQLFGHVKGAFTDAREEMSGYFRAADGGTLFLDEVGELPLSLQPKLLRSVETHEVQPVGCARSFKVDIRLVVATNRDLRAMVNAGTFRADLYYRLNATTLKLPSLKERQDGLGAFISHFIHLSNECFGKSVRYISCEAFEILSNHEWRGNLRELRHAIEAAVILAEHDRIGLETLPDSIRESYPGNICANGTRPNQESNNYCGVPFTIARPPEVYEDNGIRSRQNEFALCAAPTISNSYSLDDAIKAALLRALRKANGNCHHSAKLLGISRYTVYRMMARYGLGQVRNYRDSNANLAHKAS
jgi:transcriptional regulator with GAF, ATPase, and Fis domain